MTYKILNPRIGTPGDEYIPRPGVNIDALLNAGFIVEIASPTSEHKPATVKKKKPAKD
jgi:hypothetical protein